MSVWPSSSGLIWFFVFPRGDREQRGKQRKTAKVRPTDCRGQPPNNQQRITSQTTPAVEVRKEGCMEQQPRGRTSLGSDWEAIGKQLGSDWEAFGKRLGSWRDAPGKAQNLPTDLPRSALSALLGRFSADSRGLPKGISPASQSLPKCFPIASQWLPNRFLARSGLEVLFLGPSHLLPRRLNRTAIILLFVVAQRPDGFAEQIHGAHPAVGPRGRRGGDLPCTRHRVAWLVLRKHGQWPGTLPRASRLRPVQLALADTAARGEVF
jgi:hypothetical protein